MDDWIKDGIVVSKPNCAKCGKSQAGWIKINNHFLCGDCAVGEYDAE